MKTNLLTIGLLCLLFSAGTVAWVSAQKTSATPLKSIHLFDLPEGVTEAELAASLKEMNTAIIRSGYKDAGYSLYKVEGERVENYHYFFEGVWPGAEAYKKIHEGKMYLESDKKASLLIQKIRKVELCRRLIRLQ